MFRSVEFADGSVPNPPPQSPRPDEPAKFLKTFPSATELMSPSVADVFSTVLLLNVLPWSELTSTLPRGNVLPLIAALSNRNLPCVALDHMARPLLAEIELSTMVKSVNFIVAVPPVN